MHPNLPRLTRRGFLSRTAGGIAAVGLSGPVWRAMAGPFDTADFEQLVPRDKRLTASWVRSLTERGNPTEHRGADLRRIGMPVGGIGCGQLYLGGDGRLWLWDIFNQPPPPEAADYRGPYYEHPLAPTFPIEQGFALELGSGAHRQVRRLDASGFNDIRFRGQYPIGHVTYHDVACPVEVTLDAFSPFIPLEVDDSSLPVTVLEFTVLNTTSKTLDASLAGWIENASCPASGRPGRGFRTNAFQRLPEGVVLRSEAVASHARQPPPGSPRRDIVFDDFERETYAPWEATGTAFGSGPVAMGAMPKYQGAVKGQGRRVVNSHASAPGTEVGARDAATGILTSQPFAIDRRYIHFLIGGGGHRGKTCLNLLVDGRSVLSATGENNNELKRRSWNVEAWTGRAARLQLVDAESGPWGNIGLDHVVFSDTPADPETRLEDEEDYGSLALALAGDQPEDFGRQQVDGDSLPQAAFANPARPRDAFSEGQPVSVPFGKRLIGCLGRQFRLRPGGSASVTFLVAWHFAAVRRESLRHVTDIDRLKRAYANRFASAADVARHTLHHMPRLSATTHLWRKTWYDDSTLPHWFLERTFLNISTLATATALHFDNGRFYGWEGTYCCAGTCQHVWQYAQAVGRVFPALERSVREFVDYGIAFHPDTGAMDYRAEAHRVVAIDGQAGTILRTLREHRMSADDSFLRRLWPRIRKSVEHLIGRDAGQDGILDGEQYNTLDASWYGEIPWLSSLYLAALRAAAAMARDVGDTAFATRCEMIADTGSSALTGQLFDGEYFIQRQNPAHPESINTNAGCHIDQVYGQSWAFQVGLPRVLPPAETRQALEALWRYNFTPDAGVYRDRFKVIPGGRWYAMPGEGGLLMCTWPKGGAEEASGKGNPTFLGYFNECMTGFEYQVAAHMIWEGLLEKGLAITRMIHDRYAAAKRNPFNEVECSNHYARAMASHGVYLAACGFDYDGPRGEIGLDPRLNPSAFRCAFIGAEGWGTFAVHEDPSGHRAELTVRHGQLAVSVLRLGAGNAAVPRHVALTLDGDAHPASLEAVGHQLRVVLQKPARLTAGQSLVVTFG